MADQLIVTGANGYIGRRLVADAIALGWRVCVLGRDPRGLPPGVEFRRWALGDPIPPVGGACPSTALIHLAHDWRVASGAFCDAVDDPNVEGTRELVTSALAAGVGRVVFVSSLSARVDAPNAYGRIKYRAEQAIAGPQTVIARVGLVYGGPRQAMYGLLCKLSGLPILPMVALDRLVQPIGLDEVCRGLLRLAASEGGGIFGLAGPRPIPFGRFLTLLAGLNAARGLALLRVPLFLALLGCHFTRVLPFLPTVDPERVRGLSGTQFRETKSELDSLGIQVRDFGMAVPDLALGRRGLLAEARVMLCQVLGHGAPLPLVRRYVQAVMLTGNSRPLQLPLASHRWPGILRWREPIRRDGLVAERFRIAMRLVDASREGSVEFQPACPSQRRFPTALELIATGLLEVFRLCTRLLYPLREPRG